VSFFLFISLRRWLAHGEKKSLILKKLWAIIAHLAHDSIEEIKIERKIS